MIKRIKDDEHANDEDEDDEDEEDKEGEADGSIDPDSMAEVSRSLTSLCIGEKPSLSKK